MNYHLLNNNSGRLFSHLAILGLLLITACNPTKYVPEGETLLDKSDINNDSKTISNNDLSPYLKQKPNKKIFGSKFHLGLYNLSKLEKTRWPHGWLRDIGEEPVIFDSYSTEKSTEQLENYLSTKGYFDAEVSSDVFVKKKKTDVTYNIKSNEPYRIRKLNYEVEDDNIRRLIFLDTVNCLIEPGQIYDFDIVQAERIRMERFIKDLGFYSFSREHIFFTVDFSPGNNKVDINYEVRKFLVYNPAGRAVLSDHNRYRVKDVFIYSDYDTRRALDEGEEYFGLNDTTLVDGYYFIKQGDKAPVKNDVIMQSLFIKPGDLFQVSNMERSQSHLNNLQTFRLVNIRYQEAESKQSSVDEELPLNCIIQLTPVVTQEYRIELEGTHSGGNLGGALNLIYRHRNLFRGAEQFDMKLKAAYEALPADVYKTRSILETGFETGLTLPKFLLPFMQGGNFTKKYNPKTTIKAAYNYQSMPFYTRTVANGTFGYNWRSGQFTSHAVNPVQLNLVKLPFIDEDFRNLIDTTSYLAYSYRDVFILGGNYIYVFNNQNIKKSRDYWFMRLSAEFAGNLISLGYRVTGTAPVVSAEGEEIEDSNYELFGQPFAQYIKGDIDLRYNISLNDVSSIVYRGFAGIGFPYGNSRAMPFEKQYFGGGANGIRAWSVRSLGPGSYTPVDSTFFNSTADIKLEFNAEYRFKLFWILEGALFLDAGNIWTFYEDEDRPGAQFRLNDFYNDLAVGTGFGLRFDLNFVIIRTDLGMKLRDPQFPDNPKWLFRRRGLNFRDDFNLSFSIGYPF